MEGIRDEFISDRKGQKFVRFAGVLDLAHQRGLKDIAIHIEQIPSPENGNLAVVIATVTFADGRCFQDVGDCSPANCSPQIAVHALRMAATRAQGRAMGRALNISVALIEELADDDQPAPARAVQGGRPAPQAPTNGDDAASVCVAAGCGEVLNKNIALLSKTRYGKPLCPTHQKDETPLVKG